MRLGMFAAALTVALNGTGAGAAEVVISEFMAANTETLQRGQAGKLGHACVSETARPYLQPLQVLQTPETGEVLITEG